MICIFEIISLVELIETLFLLTVSYNNLFKFFFLCQAKIIIESPAPQPQPPNTLPMVSTVWIFTFFCILFFGYEICQFFTYKNVLFFCRMVLLLVVSILKVIKNKLYSYIKIKRWSFIKNCNIIYNICTSKNSWTPLKHPLYLLLCMIQIVISWLLNSWDRVTVVEGQLVEYC